MKRLVFIVEGETEEAFVNTILRPYFQSCGIYNPIQCFKIKHTQGGMHKYSYVRNDVLNTIYENDAVITTMFDLYGRNRQTLWGEGTDANPKLLLNDT